MANNATGFFVVRGIQVTLIAFFPFPFVLSANIGKCKTSCSAYCAGSQSDFVLWHSLQFIDSWAAGWFGFKLFSKSFWWHDKKSQEVGGRRAGVEWHFLQSAIACASTNGKKSCLKFGYFYSNEAGSWQLAHSVLKLAFLWSGFKVVL